MLIIGHRGAMGYEPENTLRSFKKAIELGVDMVECDIYVCKTGEVVVIHDDTVDRTTNGTGWVIEKTFSELRSLNAGKGEKIPTLDEVLALVNKQAKVNVELKGPHTAEAAAETIKRWATKKGWEYPDFIVSSFNHYEVQKFNKVNPGVETGLIMLAIPIGYAEFANKLNTSFIVLSKETINQEFVDDIHKRGKKVYVWVINDKNEMKRFGSLGIDGVFSNFPDRVK
ncbi:glycerophosphodiester phosphodiesterase [Candidatus Kaiserbacteria bacterium]|nr:glycerophosphodiester phosphodiesterase [Candidatus Kaiserbacteria bacterium]